MLTLTRTDARSLPGFALADPERDAAAESLYRQHMQDIYGRTDRMFAKLMVLQWAAAIVFALWVSPLAWAGSDSRTHVHVYAAMLLGGAISALPIALAIFHPGAAATRYTIATAQMLMSALLIHLTGGRIETHFHVFGSLAFLAFYRDWRVLVPATVIVAADHALRGLFWPQSVYGLFAVSSWRWVEHAAWVIFEDVFLVMSCLRGTREAWQIAVRTATLQRAHEDQRRHAVEQTELVARLRHSQREVEAATRAKSEFVANMSHELRTPLNAITLYSELLQEDAQLDGRDGDVADLAKIRGASKHLLGLINGLLDLSKIEAGKMDLELQTFDVRMTVEELVDTIGALVRQNGNTLTVTFDGDPGTMTADITKTRQILFNLLSNAAKFTSDGAIALRTSRGIVDGVDTVEFVVTDTGIGVTDEQKARLFRPFVQADTSIARKYGGTGLGLALVSRFCDLMGGSVAVETPDGGGARFIVRLPASATDAGAAQPAA
jgi:two-component system sensor histidine kinase/response regulator